MAQQKSLADALVRFMRTRDEASEKVDAMPHEGDAWPKIGMMLEQQERMVSDVLFQATMTSERLGSLAELLQEDAGEPDAG